MREHCRESSRNFPGRAAKRRAGPALGRTGRAGPGRAEPGPTDRAENFSARSQLYNYDLYSGDQ
jgi:hypothetical protein